MASEDHLVRLGKKKWPENGGKESKTDTEIFDHGSADLDDRRRLFRELLISPATDRASSRFHEMGEQARKDPALLAVRYILPSLGVFTAIKAAQRRTKKRTSSSTSSRETVVFPLSYVLCFRPPLALVELMVDLYPNAIEQTDEEERLPLHHACLWGADANVIGFLIQRCSKAVRKADCDGSLPLHLACSFDCRNHDDDTKNSIKVVQYLLDKYPEAISVAKKDDGRLPLHQACATLSSSQSFRGISPAPATDEAIIRHLVALSPEACRARTVTGSLPLHHLLSFGTLGTHPPPPGLVQVLLEAYPTAATVASHAGQLPLHRACASVSSASVVYNDVNDEIIRLVLAANVDAVRATSRVGKLPLHQAVEGRAMGLSLETLCRLVLEYPESVTVRAKKARKTAVELAEYNLQRDADLVRDGTESGNGGVSENVENNDNLAGEETQTMELALQRRLRKEHTVAFLKHVERRVEKLALLTGDQRGESLRSIVDSVRQQQMLSSMSESMPAISAAAALKRRPSLGDEALQAGVGPVVAGNTDNDNTQGTITSNNPSGVSVAIEERLSQLPGAFRAPGINNGDSNPDDAGTIFVTSGPDDSSRSKTLAVAAEVVPQNIEDMQLEITTLRAQLAKERERKRGGLVETGGGTTIVTLADDSITTVSANVDTCTAPDAGTTTVTVTPAAVVEATSVIAHPRPAEDDGKATAMSSCCVIQ